jgi:CheY-like chemotaxis protein
VKILVVDDEPGLRQTVSRILGAEGHTVGTAGEGEEALSKLSTEDVDLVLCDLRMPKMDGLEFIERYTSGGGNALVIAMSAYGDSDTAIAAMQ